jgi:hypothetical protein
MPLAVEPESTLASATARRIIQVQSKRLQILKLACFGEFEVVK